MLEQRFQPGDEPVPGFMLRKFLGAGNFGEVWETSYAGDVKAAMKILSEIDRKAGRKAFKALQLVKNLNHPHLVKIVGFWLKDEQGNLLDVVDPNFSEESSVPGSARAGETDDTDLTQTLKMSDLLTPDTVRESPSTADRPAQLFIAMGLAEETLDQCLKRHQKQTAARGKSSGASHALNGIPRDELLRYLEGAAKGLDFLNIDHNIQHGDVKPANVMIISGEGQVSDFDLAHTLVDVRSTTTKAGTLAYMAPEVCTDGVPSPSSDQYALAVTYYEMRTGKLPYSKETVSVVIQEKVTGRLDLSLLPKAERKVIRRAISVHPTARYGSCGELIKELRGREMPLSRFLKYAAALLLFLAAGLTAWQFLAPMGYRPLDLVRTDSLRQEKLAELKQLMDKVVTDKQSLTGNEIDNAFNSFGDVLINVKETEKSMLRTWRAILMNEGLTELRKSLFACKSKQDALSLQEGLLAQLKEQFVDLPPWLQEDHDQDVAWKWKLALDEARLNAIAMEPQVSFAVIDGQLKDIERPSSIDTSEDLASTALRTLSMAEQSESNLLTPDVIEPLAALCRQDREFPSLTKTERSRIVDLLQNVRRQTDDRIKTQGSTASTTDSVFSRDMAGDLEVITGIRVPLLLQINVLRSALETAATSDEFSEVQGLLAGTYSGLALSSASQTDAADDHAALQRIEELELLLFLKNPDSQDLPLNDARTENARSSPADQARKVLTTRNPYYGAELFCNAMLSRAELSVLGQLKGTSLPLKDVAAVLNAANFTTASGDPKTGYQHWLNWILGVANINPSSSEYADYDKWAELCQPFPSDSDVRKRVSPVVAAIIGLCQTECLAVSNMGTQDWRLPTDKRQQFEASLAALTPEMVPQFTPYYLFCEALHQFTIVTQQLNGDANDANSTSALLAATQRLISALQQQDSLKELLKARQERISLTTKIVLRATLADDTSGRERDKQQGFVKNPFRDGGPEAACTFLQFILGQSAAANGPDQVHPPDTHAQVQQFAAGDEDLLAVVAPAAYFKKPPDYAAAAKFADLLIERHAADAGQFPQDLPAAVLANLVNGLLISADSHARVAASPAVPESERVAQEPVAIRSVALLAQGLGDKAMRDKVRISDSAYFEKLMDGMRLAENSHIGPVIQDVRNKPVIPTYDDQPTETLAPVTVPAPALDAGDAALRANAATIFSAAASFLPSTSASYPPKLSEQQEIRPVYFLIASKLEPGNVQYLVDYAVASLGLPATYNDPEIEIQFLKDVTNQIGRIDAKHVGKSLLEGRLYVLEARRAASRQEKVSKYQAALSSLEGLKTTDIRPQYQTTIELTNANAEVELANVLPHTEENLPEIRRLLEEAIRHCTNLSNMSEEQKSLVYLPFLYMAWGNATEDLEYLAGVSKRYEDAIKLFQTGRDAAVQKGDDRFPDIFDFSIARCIFRISYTSSERIKEYDLEMARQLLQQVLRIDDATDPGTVPDSDILDKPLFAECCVYLGRIHERLALGQADAEASLAELDKSAMYMAGAVKLAYSVDHPERYLWKLEYAETAADACATSTTQAKRDYWMQRSKDLINELLTDKDDMMSHQDLPREYSEIALAAIVKVLMELGLDLQYVNPYVDSAVKRISDADIRAHLLLRRAQYACDGLIKYADVAKVTEVAEKELRLAQSSVDQITDTPQGESRDIWAARVAGQRALLSERAFWASLRDSSLSAEKRVSAGIAAVDELNRVLQAFEQLPTESAQRDAVWLRYAQALIAEELTKGRKPDIRNALDADTKDKLTKGAIAELRKIRADAWKERTAALCRKTVLQEGWTWGFSEIRGLTLRRKPIDYNAVVRLLQTLER